MIKRNSVVVHESKDLWWTGAGKLDFQPLLHNSRATLKERGDRTYSKLGSAFRDTVHLKSDVPMES